MAQDKKEANGLNEMSKRATHVKQGIIDRVEDFQTAEEHESEKVQNESGVVSVEKEVNEQAEVIKSNKPENLAKEVVTADIGEEISELTTTAQEGETTAKKEDSPSLDDNFAQLKDENINEIIEKEHKEVKVLSSDWKPESKLQENDQVSLKLTINKGVDKPEDILVYKDGEKLTQTSDIIIGVKKSKNPENNEESTEIEFKIPNAKEANSG